MGGQPDGTAVKFAYSPLVAEGLLEALQGEPMAGRRVLLPRAQEAREVLAEGNSISAREAAISANRASPDLVPASVLAARSYIARRDTRNATRVLQKTWSVQPHPSIAAAYAEIVPDETPAQRLRRFEDLIRQAPGHEESRLLQAELMLSAEDFPVARPHALCMDEGVVGSVVVVDEVANRRRGCGQGREAVAWGTIALVPRVHRESDPCELRRGIADRIVTGVVHARHQHRVEAEAGPRAERMTCASRIAQHVVAEIMCATERFELVGQRYR